MLDPLDRDLIIRTIIGEAGREPPEGQAGVAHVIRNRLSAGTFGKGVQDVLFAPKQFEPWQTRRAELMAYSPDSPPYQRAARIVDEVWGGARPDPTGGALNFANIDTVRERGNSTALDGWIRQMQDNGSAIKIGRHTFGNPAAKPADGFSPEKLAAVKAQVASAAPADAAGDFDPEKLAAVKNSFAARFDGEGGGERPDMRKAMAAKAADAAPSRARSGFLGAVQGLTANFGDEITAGINAGVDAVTGQVPDGLGAAYDSRLASIRKQFQEAESANPGTFLAGQVGGGVASAPLLPAVRGPIATGAAYGALSGAGAGEGAANRAIGAGIGAGIGGAVGAATGPVVQGIAALGRGTGRVVGDAVRAVARPEEQALRSVQRRIAEDAASARGAPGAAGVAQGQAAGQPMAVIDAGGEGTRGLARAAANLSPEARDALGGLAERRFETQAPRVTEFIQRMMGGSPDAAATREALQRQAAAANRPAYQRAYADGDTNLWDGTLEAIVNTSLGQTALRNAIRRAADHDIANGFRPMNPRVQLDDAERFVFERGGMPSYPNLQLWDYTKRELDRMAKGANADPLAGQLARRLREHLDEIVPSYRNARGTAERYFGADDALTAGQKFVTSRMTNAEARRNVARLSRAERQLFSEGFATNLVESVNRAGDRRNVVNAIFGTPSARERVEIALGRGRAAELEAFLRRETIMDGLRTALGNSSTTRQMVEAGLLGAGGGLALGGDPSSAGLGTVMAALAKRGQIALNQRIARRIGELLASEDPAMIRRATSMIGRNPPLMNALRRTEEIIAGGSRPLATEGATEPLTLTVFGGARRAGASDRQPEQEQQRQP